MVFRRIKKAVKRIFSKPKKKATVKRKSTPARRLPVKKTFRTVPKKTVRRSGGVSVTIKRPVKSSNIKLIQRGSGGRTRTVTRTVVQKVFIPQPGQIRPDFAPQQPLAPPKRFGRSVRRQLEVKTRGERKTLREGRRIGPLGQPRGRFRP